jgi:hypothetical protein
MSVDPAVRRTGLDTCPTTGTGIDIWSDAGRSAHLSKRLRSLHVTEGPTASGQICGFSDAGSYCPRGIGLRARPHVDRKYRFLEAAGRPVSCQIVIFEPVFGGRR